jgi:hypothetical protein
MCAATAETRHARRSVLAEALFACVVDAHDDEGLDTAVVDVIVGSLSHVPVHAWNEGGGAIEEILTVVEIEDGKGALEVRVVAGGKIDDEIALVA